MNCCQNGLVPLVLVLCTLHSLPSVAQDTLAVSRVVASAKPSVTAHSAPLQAMTGEEFGKRGMKDVYEAVRSFAGVTLKDYGGVGGIRTVSVRSLGTQHTAVAYDGIAMTDLQSGQIDISRFSLDNVSLVSLTVGQSDDIFRSARLGASAGTVEIRTMKPVFEEGHRSAGAVKMDISSFGTYNPSAIYERRLSSRWCVGLSGDCLTSDGEYPFTIVNGGTTEEHLRSNSDVLRFRSEASLYGETSSGGSIVVRGNLLFGERGLPGSVVLYNEKADERLWDRNWFVSAAYDNHFGEKLDFKAAARLNNAWNRYTDESEKYAGGMVEDIYSQNEYYLSTVLQCRATGHIRFSIAQDLAYGDFSSNIPECAFPRRLTSQTLLSGQYRGERLTFTAGALATYVTESVLSGEAAPDRKRITPTASLSCRVFSKLRIRTSYQDGYRVPTFNDLYYSRVGNTSLESEKTRQVNLGATWDGRMKLTADLWAGKVTDKIVAVPTMFIWKVRNIGKVEMAGLDLSAAGCLPIDDKLSFDLSAAGSYQYAVDVTDEAAKNYRHQIPYTPRISGSAAAVFNNPWVTVSYTVRIVGPRYSAPQNISANLMKGYADHSVAAGRDFLFAGRKIRLQADVANLSGINYEVVKNYPMPGRSYRMSMKYCF